ncbi:Fur family transcriptional regulator [Aeromicrobium wangtongii]|uniref:Fur family transcriptional regulator n=1 Tax=Aeromicrobium wangtongii TaxID=2969247 RepID=UPI0020181A61|nr:Fur family transcriptional regulator [Aeromicrobium wangtongii]MCL3817664.1 transcriptional repressor [Aeromicrobium wangtongii]
MTSTSTTRAAGESPRPGSEQQLRDMLRGYGLRRTAQRLAVLHLLTEEHGRHLITAEIHERLVDSGTDVDLATVYRTITTLLNLGILHATAHPEQATSYGLAAESHHHAVCTRCGSVTELAPGALQGTLEVAQRATDFQVRDSVITIHGLCVDCQAA